MSHVDSSWLVSGAWDAGLVGVLRTYLGSVVERTVILSRCSGRGHVCHVLVIPDHKEVLSIEGISRDAGEKELSQQFHVTDVFNQIRLHGFLQIISFKKPQTLPYAESVQTRNAIQQIQCSYEVLTNILSEALFHFYIFFLLFPSRVNVGTLPLGPSYKLGDYLLSFSLESPN